MPLSTVASTRWRPAALGLLRAFFALLLVASGVAKLLDMPGFVAVVDSYRVLPAPLLAPSAWALALFELALGLAVALTPRGSNALRLASLWLLLLHGLYLLWLGAALWRGLNIPNCGCFGVYWPRPLALGTLLEDSLLILLALALCGLAWRARR
jgi:Methylamine utilisation protein MauE